MNTKYMKLPNGDMTSSRKRYINEWANIRENIESILDVRVYALDPHICVMNKDGLSCAIPIWLANKIIDKQGNI